MSQQQAEHISPERESSSQYVPEQESAIAKALDAFLADVWNGRLPLWFHFWVLYSFVSLAFCVPLESYINIVGAPGGEVGSLSEELGNLLGVVLLIITFVVYEVIATVGVWRSARRYTGSKVWPVLVRILVVFSLVITFGSFM